MALFNAEFFKTFNKLASKKTASLNAENYYQFHQLTEHMNQLITKHQYSHQLSKWSYIHDNLGPAAINDCLDDEYFKNKYSIATSRCHFYLNFLKTIFTLCLDTKTCIIGYFNKCKHHVCADCYDQLNNKYCMLCQST